MRAYCWYTGNAFTMLDNGDCPECGKHGRDHRPLAEDECGSFADCRYGLIQTNKRHDGHPCELSIGHEGDHRCPEAEKLCKK